MAQNQTTPTPSQLEEAGNQTSPGNSQKLEDSLKAAEQETEPRTKKQEEAHQERRKQLLDILTAENGTNPTAIVGRFQLANTYSNSPTGAKENDTTFRIDLPMTPTWLLRADVPVSWEDPNKPGTSNAFGLSDLLIRTGWRVYQSPQRPHSACP